MTSTTSITSVWPGVREAWSGLCAVIRAKWSNAVRMAALPGMGWLIGSLLAANAGVTTWAEGEGDTRDSLVGAVVGAPFRPYRGGGCYLGWQTNMICVHRSPAGALSVTPFSKPSAAWWEPAPDTTTLIVDPPSSFDRGVWSPTLATRRGRSLHEFAVGSNFTDTDLKDARAAIVEAWPALASSGRVYFASSPLETFEIDAIKAGDVGYSHSLHLGWLVNDLLIVLGLTLLVAGHPQRLARWRAARGPRQELVSCPSCRYALAGLPTAANGVRTCPECGTACGAFA